MTDTRLEHLETLARDTHELLEFMGNNAGSTNDWPVRIVCDSDCVREFTQMLNRVLSDLKALGYDQTNPKLVP